MPRRPNIQGDWNDYTTAAVTGHSAIMARLLKAELERRGMTQRQFAELVGATEERISLVLRCIRRADPATLDRWARLLDAEWRVELVTSQGSLRLALPMHDLGDSQQADAEEGQGVPPVSDHQHGDQ